MRVRFINGYYFSIDMPQDSIIQMLVSGQNDLEWFKQNLDYLKSKYNNKFIAFQDKEVIESYANLDELMKKLEKKGINISRVFIEFVSKIKTIL